MNTRDELMEAQGFVYKGRVGIVPCYLGRPNGYGEPAVAARYNWLEFVLDAQEAFHGLVLKVMPDAAMPVAYHSRIDGRPMPDNIEDL